jgi:hypothetical protein
VRRRKRLLPTNNLQSDDLLCKDRSIIDINILSLFLRGKATYIAFYLTILTSIPCFDPDRHQIAETPERGNFYVLFQSIRSFQRLPLLAVSILPLHISRLSNEVLLYPLIRYFALLLLRSRPNPAAPYSNHVDGREAVDSCTTKDIHQMVCSAETVC